MIQIIEYASFCEKGNRKNNEDFIVPRQKQGRIYVLCDGMGGHGHGEVASETVATSVYQYLEELQTGEYTPDLLQEALDFALEQLNKADIYNDERRMGTTLVIVVLNRYSVLVGHVGDSRCYLMDNNGNKKFRTKDHSVVAEAVENEILSEEEAFTSSKKNILTRSVQAGKNTKIEIAVDVLSDIAEGDYILLCTDGVNDALRDNEIEAALYKGTFDERISRLKEECAFRSNDNYSAIFFKLHQDEQYLLTSERGHYCSMCGKTIIEDFTICDECEQKQQNEKQRELEDSLKNDDKHIFKRDYFKKIKLDNPEEYINFWGINLKKGTYVLGSIWIIIGLFVICLILSAMLLHTQKRKSKDLKHVSLCKDREKPKEDQNQVTDEGERSKLETDQVPDSIGGKKVWSRWIFYPY